MAAMTTSSKTSAEFIKRIKVDYPQFSFKPGSQEHWSPRTKTITYDGSASAAELRYGLLHELAHALLEHDNYRSDFELLKLESQAWEMAVKVGRKYNISLDNEHIQDCLDTYRDWLHRRSKCPTCGMHVLQKDVRTYQCFNCGDSWQVSAGRFARPYRLKSS
jgi:hypothetical protein